MLIIIIKFISFFVASVLVLGFPHQAWAESLPATGAEACVLMYEDGQCIYEKNADDKMLIASTTKIMTAIVSIENAKLSDTVRIKASHCNVEGSSMYLKAGERYTVKELLLGLMLASGNDAALALAEHVAGDVSEFAKLMNEKAKELGMSNSSFANPHGLDARGHYSTARDMAKLMFYCMENESFREISSCYTANIKGESYVNHNRLLRSYSGCIGGKTGFTAAAGRCLVSCCERGDMRFVCVTLSDVDDWRDHAALYDMAYANYSIRDLGKMAVYQVPVVSGSRKSVVVVPAEKIKLFAEKNEEIQLRAEIPVFIYAPVKMGETAGGFCVIIKNNVVAEYPLVYAQEVKLAFPA